MDFVVIDLEQPEGIGTAMPFGALAKLTGRLLEFLSSSEYVDGKSDPRLEVPV